MKKKDVISNVMKKLSNNFYTKQDIADLARTMKEDYSEIVALWKDFQSKHKVTEDMFDEILIDKLKVIYQVDAQSANHKKYLDELIDTYKKRKTWT